MSSIPHMLFLLVGAHFVADYPLQGDFLAKAKNRTNPIPGFPWWQALLAHSGIHGFMVALITGYWWLGLFEVIAHFIIDDAKCRGKIGLNLDQLWHFTCKLVWLTIVIWMGS